MRKRGQLTVLIIIGLLILVSVIIFFAINSANKKKLMQKESENTLNLNIEREILKKIVDDCIEESYVIARDDDSIGMGIYNSKYESYMKSAIPDCINRIIEKDAQFNYKNRGLKFEMGKIDVVFPPPDKAVSIDVIFDPPLQLSSTINDANKIELNKFNYFYPLFTNNNIILEGGKITKTVKIETGDGNILVFPEGTSVEDEEGNPIDLEKLKISVKIDDEDPGSFKHALGGGIVYKISTEPDQVLYFDPKVHFIKNFKINIDMNRRDKQFSCFKKTPESNNMLPNDVVDLLQTSGYDPNLVPMPTYGDTENDQMVCYTDSIGQDTQIIFYEENCLSIIHAYLPQCDPNTNIGGEPHDCMCGSEYIKANDVGKHCQTNPPGLTPQCGITSKEPNSLPCKCDRFIIYCQDIERVPKSAEEINSLNFGDIISSLDFLNAGEKAALAAKLVVNKEEAIEEVIIKAYQTGNQDTLLGFFLKKKDNYDPLVCSPRKT